MNAHNHRDQRQIIIEAMRTGLWLPVIQTILWLTHGSRDGLFQEWSQAALGPEGNLAFWVLSILWMCLAVLPLLISIWANSFIRWLTFAFSVFFLIAASMDWVGEQNSEAYQYPLKLAHTLLAIILVYFSYSWAKQPDDQ